MTGRPETGAAPLKTLQIGLEWFPERPGGLNRVFYDLARHLPEAGVEFTGLVTGTREVESASAGRVRAVCPTASPLGFRWWEFRRHARRCLAEPHPLVAAHFALNALPVLGLLDGRPLVFHFHGPWAAEAAQEGSGQLAGMMRRRLERTVYRRSALSITLSRAFATVLERDYGVPGERIRVVPGGVDLSPFAGAQSRAEARAALGWPGDRPIVLAVRRLVRRMGLEDLITAVGRVSKARPDVLLLVAGSGPLRPELEARIEAGDLGRHVRLLGRVPDDRLSLAYRAADVSVVPTVALEGFGLIAVESLAAGTPVLVTPVGGLPEVVRDLSPALVLEGTGSVVLTDALLAVLRGDRVLPDGDRCRAYARDHFDVRLAASRVAAVYREALS